MASSSTATKQRTIFEAIGEFQTDERTSASTRYDTGVVDRRLAERYEAVAIGEEAAKFAFDSVVVPRPQRANKPVQRVEVLPSIQVTDLMTLEKNVTTLESAIRGVSFVSSTILEMEKFLAGFEDNQQAVRRALDAVDMKVEGLHQQCKKNLGAALDAELAANMCRKMEVLSALAPAINGAKANIDALEAIVGEWDEVKRGAEMVVRDVEAHEKTLDEVEAALEELEEQLTNTEKNVAQNFDMFERDLLQTAKKYL